MIDALAKYYMSVAPLCPRAGQPRYRQSTSGDPDRLNGHLHILGKRPTLRNCAVCAVNSKRHRIVYFCKTLCPDSCFEKYHTQSTLLLLAHNSSYTIILLFIILVIIILCYSPS